MDFNYLIGLKTCLDTWKNKAIFFENKRIQKNSTKTYRTNMKIGKSWRKNKRLEHLFYGHFYLEIH